MALLPVTVATAAPQLLARWRFDDGPGTLTLDDTGRYPARLGSAAQITSGGIAGTALTLNGTAAGFASAGDVLPLTNSAFSIAFWCRPVPANATALAYLVAKHQPGVGSGYFIALNTSPRTISVFAGQQQFNLGIDLNDGVWHHLVLCNTKGGLLTLYVDGVENFLGSSGFPQPNTSPLTFGGASASGSFAGSLDDIQFYDEALTSAEVSSLRSQPGSAVAELRDLQILPPGGPSPGSTSITMISVILGGEIRFTLDGSEPTSDSARYTNSFPLFVNQPLVVRARIFVRGYPVSTVVDARFEPDSGIFITPPPGTFTNRIEVVLSSTVENAVFRYTVDGSEPLIASLPYTGPIALTATTRIRARAFLGRFPVSDIADRSYERVFVTVEDGISSTWRTTHFGPNFAFDPRAGALEDPDSDGSNNLQEFLAGTDPNNPDSGLRIAIQNAPTVVFPTEPGKKYRVHRRISPNSLESVLLGEITADSKRTSIADIDAPRRVEPGFYLVERLP